MPRRSSPAHGDHDFQPIPVGQRGFAKLAARHDLAIALHRQTFPGQIQVVQQLGKIQGMLEAVGGAVNRELYQLPNRC